MFDPRKQAIGPDGKDNQKRYMAGKQLPARIDLRPDGLSHAQNYAPGQGAPKIAQAADDHRFKAEDQPAAANCRVETGAHSQQYAANDTSLQKTRRPAVKRSGAYGS